ncbi:hypothetical protein M3Y98_01194300 [Aphelenchoides besseyi]|nr:hypothetical protein M3Y98_01194300 [Aphelenchoides besseyi]
MTNTDEACRLCSLLIERKPPKFSSEIKLPESVERFLADLDAPRRATVDHCIAADDYAIIQGLPGADFQILRVGAEKSLHPDVMDYGLDARIEKISGMSRLILHKKWYNEGEASVVNKLVKSLMDNKVHYFGIGVITPFRAQSECLLKIISDNHTANEYPEVSTINHSRGHDKSVIILLLTYGHNRILANDTTSHLADERRINVAFTRAKHKLILVGRKSSLVYNDFLAKVISRIPTQLAYT